MHSSSVPVPSMIDSTINTTLLLLYYYYCMHHTYEYYSYCCTTVDTTDWCLYAVQNNQNSLSELVPCGPCGSLKNQSIVCYGVFQSVTPMHVDYPRKVDGDWGTLANWKPTHSEYAATACTVVQTVGRHDRESNKSVALFTTSMILLILFIWLLCYSSSTEYYYYQY